MADPRFKNLEIKVGLFVVIAVVIIITLVVAIGISRDIFTTKVYINVFTETGENLAKGMPVKYAGFQIARVNDLYLQDDGRVIMQIGVPTKYVKWIRQDSTFSLSLQNIIGSSYIDIKTNLQSEAPNIETGSIFSLKRDQGLQGIVEQVTPVVADLREIVTSVNTILVRFADKDGDFNKLMRGLGSLGSDISNKEGSLGYLRSDVVQNEIANFLADLRSFSESAVRMAHNVESGSVTLKRSLEIFDEHSEPIAVGTNEVVNEVQNMVRILAPIVARLDQVAANLEKASQNAADGTENLDELRSEIQSIVESGNELILKIQNTWPISIGNEKTPEKVPLK